MDDGDHNGNVTLHCCSGTRHSLEVLVVLDSNEVYVVKFYYLSRMWPDETPLVTYLEFQPLKEEKYGKSRGKREEVVVGGCAERNWLRRSQKWGKSGSFYSCEKSVRARLEITPPFVYIYFLSCFLAGDDY